MRKALSWSRYCWQHDSKFLASLAAIGGVLVVAIGLWADLFGLGFLPAPGKNLRTPLLAPDATLEVVNVAIIDDQSRIREFRKLWLRDTEEAIEETGLFPLVDIKLRNLQDAAVVVKRIDFHVLQARTHEDGGEVLCSPLQPTWEYNILLKPNGTTNVQSVEISQVVEPKGADRFVVTVGHTAQASPHTGYVDYEVDLTLHYNQDSSLPLGKFRIRVGLMVCDRNVKKTDQVKSIEQ